MKRLLRHPTVQRHLPQLLKFAAVGGTGAFVDLGTTTFVVEVFGFHPIQAYFTSTFLAVIVVFTGNKFFTFKNRAPAGKQFMRFMMVYVAAILLNLGISIGLYSLGVHYLLARVAAIGFGAIWNYLLSHSFVFRRDEPDTVVI